MDDPWHVWVQEPPGGQARWVGQGFSDVRGLAMAPGGRQLAVSGRRGREQGVWLVDLEAGSMRELAGLHFSAPAFCFDGRQFAVVLDPDVDHAQLRLLDLPG